MKILNAFALESRKQRPLFYQCLLLLALVFLVVLGVFRFSAWKEPISDIVESDLNLIYRGAFVVFPCIFGITSGAALRRQPGQSIEEILPVSPFLMLSSAFMTSAMYSTLLLALVSTPQVLFQQQFYYFYPAHESILLSVLFCLLSLHLQFVMFVFSFWRKHLLRSLIFVLILGMLEGLSVFEIAYVCDKYNWTCSIFVLISILPILTLFAGLYLVARITRELSG